MSSAIAVPSLTNTATKSHSYTHKVTAGEVAAGYLTLASTPVNVATVQVFKFGGIIQMGKQIVGATGFTPDFDVLSSNQLHINNTGAATGLSELIIEDDGLIIQYELAEDA